jgi:hypothetical protein
MNEKLLSFFLLLLVLAVAVPVFAQLSVNYSADWHVLSGGGGPRKSANFQIDDVLGQWPDGRSASARYQVDPGYWHTGHVPDGKRTYLPVVRRP